MTIYDIVNSSWCHPLTLALYHSLWQGFVVVFLIFSIIKSGGIYKSNHLYLLNVTGLLVLFLCVACTFFHYLNIASMPTDSNAVFVENPYKMIPLWSFSNFNIVPVNQMVFLTWFVGASFFSFRFLIGSWIILRIKNTSSRVDERWQNLLDRLARRIGSGVNVMLLHSPRISVPMVVGFLEPVIIFPLNYFNQMTTDELESILIHELVHIKRHDFIINLVQSTIESLLFFNPAMWWMSRQARKYREFCCDDLVQHNVANKKSYFQALYKSANYAIEYNSGTIHLYHKKSELIMRIKRMLNNSSEPFHFKPLPGILALVLASFVFLSFQDNSTDSPLSLPVENEQTTIVQIMDFMNPQMVKIAAEKENDKSLKTVRRIADKVISYIHMIPDTTPDDQKMRDLEKLLEKKSKELEKLSSVLSEEIELSIETEVKKIEALAVELEKRMELKMKAFEEGFNQKEMQELERLGELLEAKIEQKMKVFEEKMEGGKMKEFEEAMERLGEEMELKLSEVKTKENKAAIQNLQDEMKVLQEQFQSDMQGFQQAHFEFEQDDEVREIKAQMEALSQKISKNHPSVPDGWDNEVKVMQEKIKKIQVMIQVKVSHLNERLMNQINVKAVEVEEIARQIETSKKEKKK